MPCRLENGSKRRIPGVAVGLLATICPLWKPIILGVTGVKKKGTDG